MKYLQNIGIALASGMLLYACSPASKDPNRQVAEGYCDCTKALFDLNQKAINSSETPDFQAIEQAFLQAKTCVSNLISRVGSTDTFPNPQMLRMLQEKCPDAAQQTDLMRELMQKK